MTLISTSESLAEESARPPRDETRVVTRLTHDGVVRLAVLNHGDQPGPPHIGHPGYDCPLESQTVRLIRHVAPNGAVRVLITNLMDSARFPASTFGDLYHQRWRIEESFKRIKHRLGLEHVTGLSQKAVEQDVAAKILCDNLQALTVAAARAKENLGDNARINHAYVHTALKPLLPALLLGKSVAKLLQGVLSLIARETYTYKENQSKPRKPRPKPHKFKTQKSC
jgi:hypothetical protein